MTDKKYDKDVALAKIKILISNFFENVGREMEENIDWNKSTLIEDIDEVLNNTEISSKQLVIERLAFDEGIKNE